MHFAFSRTALSPHPHSVTTAQKPPSTLESSLTHNSMMTCRPQAHSGNAWAPHADFVFTTLWTKSALPAPPAATDLQARSDRHSQSNATSPEHGLRKELRKELRMVPLWATEGAADMPSPSCGAVIYLCGYVFM